MIKSKNALVAATCLGLFVTGAALSTTDNFNPVGPAFAKNGGNGGGNGNGNGNGGGNNGKSADHGNSANAHDKSKVEKASLKADDDDDDNTLGPLNAAHASARARERAAPNSSVGKIATYERAREDALALTDPVLREQALDDAETQLESAFGRTLTDAQIDRVNALLDARR